MAHTPKPMRKGWRRAFKNAKDCTRLTAKACRFFNRMASLPEGPHV